MALSLALAAAALALRFMPSSGGSGGTGTVVGPASAIARCAQYLGTSEFVYERCVIGVAEERRDRAVCRALAAQYNGEYYVQTCLTAVAAAVGEVDLCPGAPGSAEHGSCVAGVAQATGSFELCGSLLGDAAAGCYLNVAIVSGDAESCSLYAAELGSKRLYCAVRLGVKLQDAGGCATLADQFQRDHCYYLSAKALQQPSLCEQITGSYGGPVGDGCGYGGDLCFSRGKCYAELARLTGDGQLCSRIPEVEDWVTGDCLLNAASSSGEVAWCDELAGSRSSYQADSCYRAAAAQSGEVAACFKVSDSNSRSSCIEAAVGATTELATCDRAPDEFSRALCYAGVGRASGDLSVCDQLPGGNAPEWAMDWPESCRDLAASRYWGE